MHYTKMVNTLLQKNHKDYPTQHKTRNEKYNFTNKLESICSEKPYSKIPDMTSAMQKVRNNNRTHKLDMVNATTSKIRTK